MSTFDYAISTPTQKKGETYPLLIIMHGIGANEQVLLDMFEQVSDEFIIISVRGNRTHNRGYCYYTLQDYGKPHMDEFEQSIEQLTEFISEVIEKYPVNDSHVYLGGFSQGAILSNALALVLGEKVCGIVSLNGYVPELAPESFTIKSVEHLHVFLSTGEADEIFPPKIGQKNATYFQEAGAKVHYKTYPTAHEVGEENKQDFSTWLKEKVKIQ